MREKLYGNLLKFVLKWRWVFIITPIALIIITVGLFGGGLIKATPFPNISFDFFDIDFAFKPGEGSKKTEEYLVKFDEQVWEVNEDLKEEFNDSIGFIDYTFQILGSSFDDLESGSHAGSIFVGLRDLEGAPINSYEIRNRIKEKIGEHPELERLKIDASNMRFGAPVSISLLGKNQEELQAAKAFLKEKLADINELQNISDNNATGKQEILIKLKPKAYFLGLDHTMISNQVRQGFYGGQAQRLQSGRDELRVWVRYPKTDRMTMGQFENMKVKTPIGNFPLSELIEYDIKRGPVKIKRFNSSREITVDAGLVDPDMEVPPIMKKIQDNIIPELEANFTGVTVDYRGQAQSSEEAMGEIISYFSIAFLIIILVLMIHFKSVWQAFIVLLMIPLGWLGGVWGHGIEGHPVSMLSAWA
jgi:multidrug efflux pump subunit AcrB